MKILLVGATVVAWTLSTVATAVFGQVLKRDPASTIPTGKRGGLSTSNRIPPPHPAELVG